MVIVSEQSYIIMFLGLYAMMSLLISIDDKQ